MKIFILTFGDRFAGSTLYRFRQYEESMSKAGASIEWIHQKEFSKSDLPKIAQADVVINQKCLLPVSLSRKIRELAKNLVFDFDDAIYTRPGKPYGWWTRWRVESRLHYWLKHSDRVIAANHHLAGYAKAHSLNTHVIPMSLDLEAWRPLEKRSNDRFVIGWTGAPANLHHIEKLDGELRKVLEKYPQVDIRIYSGKQPKLSCPYQYVPFEPGTEKTFVQHLDVGLLPLSDEPFTYGKSPIKALQYLACGVPVVGNVFGATRDILNAENSLAVHHPSDWPVAIEELIHNKAKAQTLGKKGRAFVEQHYDKNIVFKNLWNLLHHNTREVGL